MKFNNVSSKIMNDHFIFKKNKNDNSNEKESIIEEMGAMLVGPPPKRMPIDQKCKGTCWDGSTPMGSPRGIMGCYCPKKPVDCEGGFEKCDETTCTRRYFHTRKEQYGGNKCEFEDGSTHDCDYVCAKDCTYKYGTCKKGVNQLDPDECYQKKNVSAIAMYGGECPGDDYIKCSPGEGLCPKNCVGSFGSCYSDENGKCVKKYTIYSESKNNGLKCEHDNGLIVECNEGEGNCNVDCEGSWSVCNEHCSKTYNINKERKNSGKKCESNQGDVKICDPGDGLCPNNVDCEGEFTECSSYPSCERTFKITKQKEGRGGNNCRYRDGYKEKCVTCKPPVKIPKPPDEIPKPPVELPPVEVPKPPVEPPKPPVKIPKPPVEQPKPPVEIPKPPVEQPGPPVESSTDSSSNISENTNESNNINFLLFILFVFLILYVLFFLGPNQSSVGMVEIE
tara:strand:- start:2792 stop:4138 length:1347 start_codon:yes stop_codon:yes gene_type:complete